mmetsp:Transcript_63637/g.53966  ORF Transcript_63637/g.53966 Transcript_63637/m.53966 type:complete len:89 (+) Transcript_63637:472-738(+)
MLSEDPCDANLNDRTLSDPRMRLLSLCGEGETTQESVSGLGSPVARAGAGHIDAVSSSAACEGAAEYARTKLCIIVSIATDSNRRKKL